VQIKHQLKLFEEMFLNSPALRIVFAGTPDFAAQHLAALIKSAHQVVAVYCPPDKPSGRGKKLTACATKQLALQHGIPIEQPQNFKALADREILAAYQADVMVVVAYGLLLPAEVLAIPRLGCINVHGSLLPKWRGAAPIQRAVEAGDKETGVTIMQMDEGLDTGDMLLKASCEISATDTSASIYEKLAHLGPNALLTCLHDMALGQHQPVPQDNALATYAHKLSKEEALIDWQLPAQVIERKIRAYNPWPVAQFVYHEQINKSHTIKVWQASVESYSGQAKAGTIVAVNKQGIVVATGDQALRLTQLQLPGKKPLSVADVLNGRANWFTVGNTIVGSSGE
jgi:methionyl-tRNA formyltransferase